MRSRWESILRLGRALTSGGGRRSGALRSRRGVAALLACLLVLSIAPVSAVVAPAGGSANPISWLTSYLRGLKERLAGGDSGLAQNASPAVWSPPGRTAEVAVEKPKPPGKRVKEIVGKRSQFGTVYALDDGRFQAEVSAEPVNYRDAKGAWQKIDTRVQPVSEPGFVAGNDKTGFVSRFGNRTDNLVTIRLGERWLRIGLAGPARSVTPRVDGSKVTYPGLWDGADLVYEVTPEGVKKLVVLHRAPAAGTDFAFTVASSGLLATSKPDGSIAFAVAEGAAPVFTVPKPFMTDATDDPASPYGKRSSEKVAQTLTDGSGTATITITPDAAWLADKSRTWPVLIDPTVNVQPSKTSSQDVTIAENAPDTNYGQLWSLTAGTMFAGPSRSLIAFNLAGAVPSGVRIDSAELGLYFDHVIYTGGNAPVRVPLQLRRATGPWQEDTANWLTASGLGGEVVATNALEVGQVNAWHTYPITALAQGWLDGTTANYGVMLQSVDESETIIGGPVYASGEPAEDGLHVPKITITYGQPAVNLLQPEFIHATGAELSWSHYVDPSTAPGDNLVEYQVHRSSAPVFAPSAATLVAPLPEGVNAYTDTTATPADASGPDRPVYYTVAVKRADGQLIASQHQRVLLPRAGYVTQLLRAQHVAADTTLVACEATGHDRVGFAPGRAQLVTGFQYIDRNLNYGTTRTLMKFDTSGIPSNARVSAAELGMWRVADNGNQTFLNVHSLTKSFDEATASWNKASSSVNWTTPGGDYGPALSTTTLVTTPYASWARFPVTAAVQSWVATPSNNYGFLTRMAQEPNKSCGSNGEGATFLSSETAEQSLRPYLKVSYADPTGTYYAAATPISLNPGETVTVPVSVTNSTTATWPAASTRLSYWWKNTDGTDATTTGNRLYTALPADLGPGQTVTVNAQVKAPALSGDGNKAEAYTLAWDLFDTVANNWKSSSSQLPQLPQQIRIEDPTSDLLGLEEFYSYAGKNTGAGGALMNNTYAGNAVWSYNAFSNPSRGTQTFARMSYNSLDTSASSMGFGWSLQTSTVQRLGSQLSFHPPGQKWPTQVRATDGDGTTNVWVLDTHGLDVNDCTASTCDYTHPRGVHLYLQQTGSTDPTRAWVFTKPDRTQFFFDEDGFQSAIVDNNGNTMSFTYERRKSNNKPTKFLRYITDPAGRRTLTLDYYDKGEPYTYIDDATWQEVSATTLTNPFIIDNVKSLTDISGRTVTFTYTGKGLMAKMVDGFGSAQPKVFGFGYDATQGNKNVKLIKVTDPRGNDTNLSYYPTSDPQNKWKLQNLTDRLGGVTNFAYVDPDGPQGGAINATVTDAENHATAYQLDGYGRPTQITNAKNEPTKLQWDGDHNVIRVEEANGAVSTWAYDQKTGNPTEIRDAEAVRNGWPGTILTYQPQLNGYVTDLLSKTSPAGRKWTFTYTAEGDVATVTDPVGNTTPTAGDYTTTNTYDEWGQLLSVKDANGNVTSYDLFHPSGYPTVITDAGTGKSYFTYDDRGNVTEVKNNGSAKVTQAYDAYGRPTTKVEPVDAAAGRFINHKAPVYDPNDNMTTAYAANGTASTSVYDKADQVIENLAPKDEPTDPERKTTTTYDKVGNVKTVTEPQGNLTPTAGDYTITTTYDAIYQQIEVVNGLGQKVVSEYDNVGNVTVLYDAKKTASTDPADFTSKFEYDLNHRVVKTTDTLGKFTSARYDRDGLTIGTTDAEGNESLAKYDDRGALIESKVPYRKDASGNVIYRTSKYEYDQVGNQTKMITPRGVDTAADANDFALVTVYDALNRKKEEWSAYDVDDAYDTTPNKTIYTYDQVGNLTTVSAPPSHQQTLRNETKYTYYDNGWTRTSTDPWNIVTSYDYNDLGQQTKNTLTSAGGSTSRTMTWEFYPSGNQKGRSEDGLPVGKDVVLVDNSDDHNTATQGTWTRGGATGQYGYDVSTAPAGSGSAQFNWQLNIPRDGTYEVFVQYPQVSGAATDAKFTVTHNGGSVVKTVNQTQNPGTWVSLGSYSFIEDGVQKITLTDQATGKVLADAVKLVRDNSGSVDDERKQFTYRYNPNGMMVEVKDLSPGAKIDRYDIGYDQLNQISTVTEFAGSTLKNTTALTYDENGNPLTSTHDLTWSKIDYDARDMVAKVTNADSATAGNQQISTFTYTARGQLLKQVKPNGNTVDLEYYLDGATKRQVEKTAPGTVVAEHNLEYTANGHPSRDIVKVMNADNASDYLDNTYDFTYDPQDRIRTLEKSGDSAQSEFYRYDANGNTIEQRIGQGNSTSKYDRNRLHSTTSGGVTSTYNYDPLGRLDTVSVGGQRAQKHYYDGFDRTAKTTSGSGATAKSTTFVYDPFDRTVSQTTASKTTAFTYLGMDNQVLREEVAGKATKSYQYAPWGQQLTQIKHNDDGSREYSQFVYRPRGDVVGITKEDGNTRATYGYSAYGKDDESQFTGVDKPGAQPEGEEPYNAFRFNAARWDAGSGTYDMGFRNYDPGLNRFLTRDAYGGALADMGLTMNPFTGNRYAFAGGNPISFVELDGHLFGMSWSDIGHAALDVVGMIPVVGEVADVANGIWYLAEGNYVDAALSMASAIPLAGNAVAAVKLAKTGVKVAEGIDTANDARKAAETATDLTRTGDNLPTNTPDACPVPNSFVPGTRVLLANGDSKPIEELRNGDRVAAADVESSQVQSRPVTALIKGDGVKHLYTITIDTDGEAGSQTGTLVATDGHPFWLPDAGAWVPAKQLQPGMWLQTAAGTWVQITAVTASTQRQQVHNLTVEGVHTYYVLAGDEPVLVHNCKVEWKNENDPNYPNRNVDTDPQDPFPDPSVVRSSNDGMGPLRDGDHHFVITPSNEVRAVHNADLDNLYNNNVWPGHTSLAGFDAAGKPNPVLMAGRFTVTNGKITSYDNWSGHYQPQQYGGRMLQDISRSAFDAAGWAARRLRFRQY